MTGRSFTERLTQAKPLLADGAMGTLLVQRGHLSLNACFDELNLTQPDLVRGVHRDYAQAGADIIETNTFGANRYKLAERGLAQQVNEVNQTGVQLVQEAVVLSGRQGVYVAGAVGPLGVSIKPYGRISKAEARAAFQEQMQALIDAGVDLLVLETFANHEELLLAIETARSLNDALPIVAQATFSTDNTTYTGHAPARVANDLHNSGATVIGVNCGTGPAQIAQVLQTMQQAVPGAQLSALPNAGFPETVGGRAMYPASADYFGDYALTFQAIGAQIIGGCCGTTPEHIAAMRAAIDDPSRPLPDIHVMPHEHKEQEKSDLHPTKLMQRLLNNQFTVTVEITPPRGYNCDKVLTQARLLRDAGADLLNVADTPAAKMKMSAWAVSHLLQDQIGIETVLHFPTRGRNLLRVQGDLLAAHAIGLRNLFVTMGDPTRIGDYPDAMDNYDIAPSRLLGVIKQNMNSGQDMAGNSIGTPTGFVVGCALNMAADDLDHELRVLGKKLAGGADFALGQPIFDPPRIDEFLERYLASTGNAFDLPVIMGVIPLYSIKHARFLHHEVPGINIPDAIFKRLEAAGDNAPQEGVRIAIELMRAMRDRVQGAYIIPSFGRYPLAAEVVDAIAHTPVGV